jgi:Delta7-sterol 5-desaturase
MESLTDGQFYALFLVVFLRYVVVAALAFAIFYGFKKKSWSFKKIQAAFPKSKDYWREFGYSVLTAIIFTLVGWMLFMTPIRKYTQLYTDLNTYGIFYFIVSILLMLLIHDAYFYWTHRLMHHPKLFKYFHKVHHQSVNPSPWAAFAFHPLEAVVEAGIMVVIAFVMPVHPAAIGLFLLIMMIYNVYGHLGYELYPKGFSQSRIGKWINTSVNHNQHHQYFKGNYGLYFLWWDRWLGTLRTDYDEAFDRVKNLPNPTSGN